MNKVSRKKIVLTTSGMCLVASVAIIVVMGLTVLNADSGNSNAQVAPLEDTNAKNAQELSLQADQLAADGKIDEAKRALQELRSLYEAQGETSKMADVDERLFLLDNPPKVEKVVTSPPLSTTAP